MERGEVTSETFMEDITEFVQKIDCRLQGNSKRGTIPFYEKESIGKCRYVEVLCMKGKRIFYCSSHDCNFALWKESRYLVGMKKDVGSENGKGTFRAWENPCD